MYSYRIINVAAEENNPDSLLSKMKHLVHIRKENPILAMGHYEFLATDIEQVLTIHRSLDDEDMICILNLSDMEQVIKLDLASWQGCQPVDILSDVIFPSISETPYAITLAPLAYRWLKIVSL